MSGAEGLRQAGAIRNTERVSQDALRLADFKSGDPGHLRPLAGQNTFQAPGYGENVPVLDAWRPGFEEAISKWHFGGVGVECAKSMASVAVY